MKYNVHTLLEDFVDIVRYEFKLFGEKASRIFMKSSDASCILLYHAEKDAYLFVKQIRPAAFDREDARILEAPAGMINKGEEPEACIIRECLEETGYAISDPLYWGSSFSAPGLMSEQMHYFYAEISEQLKVEKGGGVEEENEYIELVWMHRAKAIELLKKNGFEDAKTIQLLLRHALSPKASDWAI